MFLRSWGTIKRRELAFPSDLLVESRDEPSNSLHFGRFTLEALLLLSEGSEAHAKVTRVSPRQALHARSGFPSGSTYHLVFHLYPQDRNMKPVSLSTHVC